MVDRRDVEVAFDRWQAEGWLRQLDVHFANLLPRLCAMADARVLVASALLAHREGLGHSCMNLRELLATEGSSLGWQEDAAEALRSLLATLSLDVEAWDRSLRQCAAVRSMPADDQREPLVWDGHRLYLRRYWSHEQRVLKDMATRALARVDVEPSAVRHWLDRLFVTGDGFDWQKAACAIAARARLSIVTGGPGTGKTYTAARLIALLCALDRDPDRLKIGLAAPTGKAAARLKQSIDAALAGLPADAAASPALLNLAERMGPGRTLHGLLGANLETRRFRHDAQNPLELDLLVVDEASMVDLEMAAALLEALRPDARLVLLGDKDQLASVEAGAVLGDLCHDAGETPYDEGTRAYLEATVGRPPLGASSKGSPVAQQTVMLRESRRFDGPIGSLAQAVNDADLAAVERLLGDAMAPIQWRPQSTTDTVVRAALDNGFRAWASRLAERPAGADEAAFLRWAGQMVREFDRCRVLSAVHDGPLGVIQLNVAVANALQADGLRPSGEWYDGRPVMVTRNDPALGVFNGDVGVTLRAPGGSLRAFFESSRGLASVATTRLNSVETAFAMTIHKSQGSEFDAVVLALPPTATASKELLYTGITRARSVLSLHAQDLQTVRQIIQRRVQRDSGIRAS